MGVKWFNNRLYGSLGHHGVLEIQEEAFWRKLSTESLSGLFMRMNEGNIIENEKKRKNICTQHSFTHSRIYYTL